MKSKILLLVVAGTVALTAAQSATPKFKRPTRSSFNELVAYNLPGYTPQQLWSFRNVEHNVKFDSSLNCYYEAWKSNGIEQKYDSYCWNKEVHWTVDGNSCMQGSKSVSITSTVNTFWSAFDQFTKYEGIVSDPYYASGQTFHRMKHSTQNRWIWFRTSDLAIVYEQFYDGTQASYVKLYEGGIKENANLFTSDFRIPKCSNPFLKLKTSFKVSPDSAFSLQESHDYNQTYGYNSSYGNNNSSYGNNFTYGYNSTNAYDYNYGYNSTQGYDSDYSYGSSYGYGSAYNSYDYDYSHGSSYGYGSAYNSYDYDYTYGSSYGYGSAYNSYDSDYMYHSSYSYDSTYGYNSNYDYYPERPSKAELQIQKYANWTLTNYDANKDGQLDKAEAQKLWNDVVSYDYSSELLTNVDQVQNWIQSFDDNGDGKLSVEDIAMAIQYNNVFSFASVKKTDPIEQKLQELADWIMSNYDVNRDQTLDNIEAEKLWRDVESYDYAGINVTDVKQAKAWIAKFDTNKDNKITVGELYKALKSETGGVSFASSIPSRRVKRVDQFEKQVQQVADWIMTNYDTNKDQTLDNFEAQKLWNDVQSYNYAGIVVVDVNQTKAWIAKFDTNKDGKITVGELANAIKAEGPVSFQAMVDESAAVDTMPNPADTMPAGEAPDSAQVSADKALAEAQAAYDAALSELVYANAKAAADPTDQGIAREVANATAKYYQLKAKLDAATKTAAAANQPKQSEEEKKLKQYAKWVLDNYDANKDGQLDQSEAKKLWNDISTYDYSGELIAQVGQIQTWIAKFDTNKNGKLTIEELYNALSKFV